MTPAAPGEAVGVAHSPPGSLGGQDLAVLRLARAGREATAGRHPGEIPRGVGRNPSARAPYCTDVQYARGKLGRASMATQLPEG